MPVWGVDKLWVAVVGRCPYENKNVPTCIVIARHEVPKQTR
ncbi:MAG TPA: hypothetical protein PLB38_02060 [bacterium]|nr:hypothetical protein [bacterium]